MLLFETTPKRSVLIFKKFYLKTLHNNLFSSQLPTLNCATFSLLEKTAEKKHLKDQKNKGNKGKKISANSNENVNIKFSPGTGKRSFVSLSKYKQAKMMKLCINPQ